MLSEHRPALESHSEHKVSGEHGACPFCSIPRKRIVAETSYFILVKPLAPIVPSEVLVIPRRHAGALLLLDQAEREEVDRIWRCMLARVWRYQCGVAFEHGNHAHATEPWHQHAHLHILAPPVDVPLGLCRHSRLKHLSDFGSCTGIATEYVFLKAFSGEPAFFVLSQPLPRHFLRNRFEDSLGRPLRHLDRAFCQLLDKCIDAAIAELPSILQLEDREVKGERG